MAPKRRSVVKTKVVKETVEVTTAVVAGNGELPEQTPLSPAALAALAPPTVDVTGSRSSRVVHVEVTTPDAGNATAKQATPGKRGRGRREDEHPAPPAPEAAQEPPVPQSQETQDPN
ncbi:unnamed protein product [Urochloa humidicola]